MSGETDEWSGELELLSESPEATEALGAAVGRALASGAVLALGGDLGSGKTCFVRGLAEGLGSTDPVSSPTYTLAHEYAGRLTLHHLDAWMAERESAFLAAGGEELLLGDAVAAVEWAGQVAAWLPRPHLALEFGHLAPEVRRVRARLELAEDRDPGPLGAAWTALVERAAGGPTTPSEES